MDGSKSAEDDGVIRMSDATTRSSQTETKKKDIATSARRQTSTGSLHSSLPQVSEAAATRSAAADNIRKLASARTLPSSAAAPLDPATASSTRGGLLQAPGPLAGEGASDLDGTSGKTTTGQREDTSAVTTFSLEGLDESSRRAIAGAFAYGLRGQPSPEHYRWARTFFIDLCSAKLELSRETLYGLMPLLGSPPSYGVQDAGDATPSTAIPALLSAAPSEKYITATPSREEIHAPFAFRLAERGDCPFNDTLGGDEENRRSILVGLMVIYLAEGRYDSRTRECFRRTAYALGVQWADVAKEEDAVVRNLQNSLHEQDHAARHSKRSSAKRWLAIGVAGVVGAGLLVATGGLAAPAILGGLAAVGGAVGIGASTAAVVTFLSSAAGAALLLTILGASGGGLASYRMARRTAGLNTFLFRHLTDNTESEATGGTDGHRPVKQSNSWLSNKWNPFLKATGPLPTKPSGPPEVAIVDGDPNSTGKCGGFHVYLVCSGLVTTEQIAGDGTSTDFLAPWGVLPPAASSPTSKKDNFASPDVIPAMPSPGLARVISEGTYRKALKGRFCVLRPATLEDREFVRSCCEQGDGTTVFAPLDSGLPTLSSRFDALFPADIFDACATGQAFVLCAPIRSNEASEVQFRELGFVSYHILPPPSTTSDSASKEIQVRLIIQEERYWGLGLGPDALVALTLHLLFGDGGDNQSLTFSPPLERARAVLCAEKAGFETSRVILVGDSRYVRMVASKSSVMSTLAHRFGVAPTSASDVGDPEFGTRILSSIQGMYGGTSSSLEVFLQDGGPAGPDIQEEGDIEARSGKHFVALPQVVFSAPRLPNSKEVSAVLQKTLSATLSVSKGLGVYNAGEVVSAPNWLDQMAPNGEKYTLVWEPNELRVIGDSTTKFARQYLTGQAVSTVLGQTVLATLMSAWTWPSYVVKALSFIDSPWTIGLDRSDKAGKVLAEVLLAGTHGRRPVSLMGYGLGARIIFVAVEEIARRARQVELDALTALAAATAPAAAESQSEKPELPWEFGKPQRLSLESEAYVEYCKRQQRKPINPFGIIHDIVLLGLPLGVDLDRWRAVRRVVSGRVVNAYCKKDFVLRFVFRSNALQWQVAGLGPVGLGVTEGDPALAGSKADETPSPDSETSSSLSSPEKLPTVWYEGIENVDATGIVDGHLAYKNKLEQIMKVIQFEKY